MKNTFIICLLFSCLQFAWGQENRSQWGLSISPGFHYMKVDGSSTMGVHRHMPTMGISLGIAGRIQVSNRLYLETGLFVKKLAYEYSVEEILLPAGIDAKGDITYTSVEDKFRQSMASIPLRAKFRVGKGFFIGGGLNFDVPVIGKHERELTHSFGEEDFLLNRDFSSSLRFFSFNLGISKTVKIANTLLDFGPQLDIYRHQLEIPFGLNSRHQYAVGFQLSVLK